MASRRTTPTAPEHTHRTLHANDASPTPRTAHEQSPGLPRVPCSPSLQSDNPNPVVLDTHHSEPVSQDPSRIAPPANGTPAHPRANHPSSNEDPSAPSSVANARKRHRNRRRNNASSQTSVADTGRTSEVGSRTQTNVEDNRPTKRARKAALSPDHGRAARNQATAGARFNRRQSSSNAATGSGGSGSQPEVNGLERIEFSETGGSGGAGGFGSLIGGTGGNGQGTVLNLVFNFPR
ncbi:hypothetical protein C8R45DRAFT_488347 [Mycena sanguinolenta]|nr:hypothetical protein C8R45DRAFT_488347 [Mycena sanguinolenta]